MQPSTSILFVCLGNICRSPAAEGVFSHLAEQAGVADRFRVDSAGTIGFHAGSPADARMRAAARKRGYQLHSISRPVGNSDFTDFDLILAMDRNNLYELREKRPKQAHADVRMFSEASLGEDWDVPDPYYGGDQGFENVLDLLSRGCEGLLQRLCADEK